MGPPLGATFTSTGLGSSSLPPSLPTTLHAPQRRISSTGPRLVSSPQQDNNSDTSNGPHHDRELRPTDSRREKNRIAQRRFRERQKTAVTVLQAELDAKDLQMHNMLIQLRVLEQSNRALSAKVLQYEEVFGPLPKMDQG